MRRFDESTGGLSRGRGPGASGPATMKFDGGYELGEHA
jgi:hypothetical protein